jgi:hypothetical protein
MLRFWKLAVLSSFGRGSLGSLELGDLVLPRGWLSSCSRYLQPSVITLRVAFGDTYSVRSSTSCDWMKMMDVFVAASRSLEGDVSH